MIGFFLESLVNAVNHGAGPIPRPVEVIGISTPSGLVYSFVVSDRNRFDHPARRVMNLFIIQAVGKARLEEVVKGAWPFALMMLATAVLLWFWQGLALTIAYGF